jgi:multicomponent K+:H+ antiporter subunit D
VSHLILLPVLIPLITGGVLLLLAPLGTRTERTVGLAATASLVAVACALLLRAAGGDTEAYYVGDWPAPFGIVMVLDRLSALMLLLTAVLASASLLYACAGDDERGRRFHALFQFQLLGVNGAFLTGDLFNLFVFFEILLISSYALLLHGSGARRTRAALHLVALNLVGSSLFLIGVGAVYAVTGTLNLADLVGRVAEVDAVAQGPLRAGGLLLLVVFALKSALLPLGLWLPPVYGSASVPVAALFAIMTKVGVYAVLRVHGLVFGPEAGVAASLATPWLVPLGLATIALGTLGVVASRELRHLLSNLVVISAGTLIVALGLDSPRATAAMLFYLLNSTLIAGGLFLLAGLIGRQRGEAGTALDRSAPVAQPVLLGIGFFVGAVGVAGLPPLAGFTGKVWLLQSALGSEAVSWIFAVVLVSGFLVIVSLARAGSAIFWRTGDGGPAAGGVSTMRATASVALLASTVVLMIAGGPVSRYSTATAAQLADRDQYVRSVLSNRQHRSVTSAPDLQGGRR